ncbi:MAG: YigZ family protein [Flavobacteriales bacterium]|nr:YigZ family protein [Flavobacteriales bacterium]
MSPDQYNTLSAESAGEVREKASRFLAYAFPVADETAFKVRLAAIAKEHHSARHICYAWVLGVAGERYRAFDAGEPAGTAGKPILRQLQGAGLTFSAIVVVRYFGGTLLGKAGLSHAFSDAAKAALHNNHIVGRRLLTTVIVRCSYADEQAVRRDTGQIGGQVLNAAYTHQCRLQLAIPVSAAEALINQWTTRGITAVPG